jgi:hypothetical protein
MKYSIVVIFTLILAGVLIAGCTSPTASPVTATPTPTILITTALPTATAQPVFSLGYAYLDKPGGYTFNSENDVIVENFRVDSQSWGIDYKIQPLNDDLQYCWFEMNVTNLNSEQTETFGYGRQYSIELERTIPMYKEGPYQITMKGNRVKAWVKAAVRNP